MATPRTQSMAAIRLERRLPGMAGGDSAESWVAATAVSVEVVMTGVTGPSGDSMAGVQGCKLASPGIGNARRHEYPPFLAEDPFLLPGLVLVGIASQCIGYVGNSSLCTNTVARFIEWWRDGGNTEFSR